MSIMARDVRRTFCGHVAIEHADVDVAPGRIAGLIGPNGCGKTTLLLVLAGLLAPDSGSVAVAGADPASDGPGARAGIGWMPDHVGTWETLTAHEIVASFGRLYGLSRAVADELSCAATDADVVLGGAGTGTVAVEPAAHPECRAAVADTDGGAAGDR